MADWLNTDFKVSAKSFQELGFQTTEDREVFRIASQKINTVVITTKDIDFVSLTQEIEEIPRVLYLNVGNVSNKKLKEIVYKSFGEALRIFSETNSSLVEISI